MEAEAMQTLATVDALPHRYARLPARHARFLTTPALQALYQASDMAGVPALGWYESAR
jgi:hypothetical protein